MAGNDLSKLGLLVLVNLTRGKSLEEIAKLAGAQPGAVGSEIAMLQMKGYISPDGGLTGKGLEAVSG